MTDKEKLIALLESFGYKASSNPGGGYFVDNGSVIIGSGGGWAGFSCHFNFDENGKFIDHACWE